LKYRPDDPGQLAGIRLENQGSKSNDLEAVDSTSDDKNRDFPDWGRQLRMGFRPRLSRRHWLGLVMLALPQTGCGTIFWPERKGQPAGRLDPKVVALDAIGLLLFFIPGVIAFAVDFNNGTIYLPPGEYASNRKKTRWTKLRMSRRQPTSEEIEELVALQTGKSVKLRGGTYRVGKLETVESLDDLNLDEMELASACEATEVRFRCQSE